MFIYNDVFMHLGCLRHYRMILKEKSSLQVPVIVICFHIFSLGITQNWKLTALSWIRLTNSDPDFLSSLFPMCVCVCVCLYWPYKPCLCMLCQIYQTDSLVECRHTSHSHKHLTHSHSKHTHTYKWTICLLMRVDHTVFWLNFDLQLDVQMAG